MRNLFYSLAVGGLMTIMAACQLPVQPSLTPLQIQAIQTKEFEEGKKIVFASVLSVFQDLGYTISNADYETGLISVESISKSDPTSKFLFGIATVSQTKATGFIETLGNRTRVRLSFVSTNRSSTTYGQTERQDRALLDPKLYENAFERIESAIFVRSAN